MVACTAVDGAGASRGRTKLGGAAPFGDRGLGQFGSGGLAPIPIKLRTTVHREVSRMPDIPETEELETLIRALIRKAGVCLQQQIDDVGRHAEDAQSHDQDALADAS